MHPVTKMLFGVVMMVGSAYAVYASIGTPWDLWSAFVTVVMGVVPALIFLIGLFIVWLELDEIKIERELKKEEEKVAKSKTKKK
jgi:hypothetical protein